MERDVCKVESAVLLVEIGDGVFRSGGDCVLGMHDTGRERRIDTEK